MSSTKSSLTRNIVAIVISTVFVLGAVWIFFNRQFILDTVNNWEFKPSSTISSIETKTDLTEKGKFIFYATKPEVLDQQSFNSSCPRQEQASSILGCYTPADRIFIYNVDNQQLNGVQEVTAVHELLHAIWYRTDTKERARLTALLEDAYAKSTDTALKDRMDYYKRTEPSEIPNELHSILGTEMATLNPELETYYSQFFKRQTVLALYQNYNSHYVQLTSEATRLADTMKSEASEIDTMSQAYNSAVQTYSADATSFKQKANSNGFSSNVEFYAARSVLVNRLGQLESMRLLINQKIETYNAQYTQYQKIAEQLQILNNSMDSYHMLEKAPSV